MDQDTTDKLKGVLEEGFWRLARPWAKRWWPKGCAAWRPLACAGQRRLRPQQCGRAGVVYLHGSSGYVLFCV